MKLRLKCKTEEDTRAIKPKHSKKFKKLLENVPNTMHTRKYLDAASKKYKKRASDVVSLRKPRRPINTHIVVKEDISEADDKELMDWMATVPGYIEAHTSTDDGPTKLYDYQIRFMNSKRNFRNVQKSRQVGFSYVYACESLARSQLSKSRYTAIFVSYNQMEAAEKIYYAKFLYDSIPAKWRRKLVVNNKHSMEFEDSTGKVRTRLLSHAQREVRGKGGNTWVYLDEIAHYVMADRIYISALPVVVRGNAGLTTGSSPNGKNNLFYSISTNPKYNAFKNELRDMGRRNFKVSLARIC